MIHYLILAGQFALVIVIYLFVWRVMRTARHDLAGGSATTFSAQESTIIPAAEVAAARRAAGAKEPRLVVVESQVLRVGVPFTVGSGLQLGRDPRNDIVLDEGVVSGMHARLVAPSTIVDNDSTNGTYVNARPVKRQALAPGDHVQLGSTVFRFEVS